MARRTVELFYDVISPYSWIGFEAICRYRAKWNIDLKLKPFFLGGIMQGADNKPPGTVPAKGAYMMGQDIPRLRQLYQIPINPLSNPAETLFIKGSLPAMRFLTAVDMENPSLTEPLSRALWTRIWSKDLDINQPESLLEAAKHAGLTEEQATQYLQKIKDPKVKDTLKSRTEEALENGAFGAPTFLVEGPKGKKHMVFGSDRLEVIAMLLGETYQGPLTEYAAKL